MKKLLFSTLACVAFAFSGFASNEVVNKAFTINDTTEELDAACTNWVTVNRSCGGQPYLCADNYASFSELVNKARQYDNVQCNGLAPTNTGTGLSNF